MKYNFAKRNCYGDRNKQEDWTTAGWRYFTAVLPDFCFIDSKLVVREKRASNGDLNSKVLCLCSVTSLLLVWLRMSSIPKDRTPTFFITTASSLVSSISASLSLKGNWNEYFEYWYFYLFLLPHALIIITTDINIFIIWVFVFLTISFPYLWITMNCNFFAHRHYLCWLGLLTRPSYPGQPGYTERGVSQSVQPPPPPLSLSLSLLTRPSLSLSPAQKLSRVFSVQWWDMKYFHVHYELFVLSITSFPEKLRQD